MLWSTKSKAFRKSTKIIPTNSLLSEAFSHFSTIWSKAVSQEWFGLKPDWVSYNNLYFSKYFIKDSWTCFSKSFERTGKIEIGLKLLGSLAGPPLCSGLTLASFHLSGNEPVLYTQVTYECQTFSNYGRCHSQKSRPYVIGSCRFPYV